MGVHKKKEPDYLENSAEERQLLFTALNAAVKAFERTFDEAGVDGAFFAIRVKGWELTSDTFEPLGRGIVIDCREAKRDKKREHR
jgi:hypothetical protein